MATLYKKTLLTEIRQRFRILRDYYPFAGAFILILSAASVLGAQQVPGTEWKQRETEHFILIYPESLEEESAALAEIMDEVFSRVSASLEPKHPKKKWPIVISDMGLVSNGYVTLLPKRSVWFTNPDADFTGSSDWLLTLALHEVRHMAQFDAADRGMTRFLHILFGESGWGLGIILGSPIWLLEGDAVYYETVESHQGRGRNPLFTKEMQLLAYENPNADYHKLTNPSYRSYHPDHYRLGYFFTSWIHENYGEEALRSLYIKSAEIPIPLLGQYIGFKEGIGKKPREVVKEMMKNLASKTIALKEKYSWTKADITVAAKEPGIRYDSLFIDSRLKGGEDVIFARQSSLKRPPYLVRIRGDEEKRLIRLPAGGRVTMSAMNFADSAGYRVAWSAIRRHPVYTGVSVSDISIVDLDMQGRVRRRFHPVKSSRYLYPALSHDGKRLSLVENLRGGGCRLQILDSESGAVIASLDMEEGEYAAHPSWSPDNEFIVFSLQGIHGQRIAEWDIKENSQRILIDYSWDTLKTPVYSADGSHIIYSSNSGEIESIWNLERMTGINRSLARRFIAAWNPAVSEKGDWLYFIEYPSSDGQQIVRTAYPGEVSQFEPDKNLPLRDTAMKREEVMSSKYPEEDFRPIADGLKLHSWSFNLQNINSRTLKMGMQLRDVLGSIAVEGGALYDTAEISPGAFVNLSFIGMRPTITLKNEYRYRSLKLSPFHYLSTGATLSYPANLSRNGIWNNRLNLAAAANLQWTKATAFLPLLAYTFEWKNLRGGSYRAFRPELGWQLRLGYSHVLPLSGFSADVLSSSLTIHLPGGFPNTFITLRAAAELRDNQLLGSIGRARGYAWKNPESTILTSIDYEFPLANLDLPLGAVFYIQRFRLGLHSDFAWLGKKYAVFDGGPWMRQWSSGMELTIDFISFSTYHGLSLGFDLNWLWDEKSFQFGITLEGLPLY